MRYTIIGTLLGLLVFVACAAPIAFVFASVPSHVPTAHEIIDPTHCWTTLSGETRCTDRAR